MATNMKRWLRTSLTVARWEFQRYFKLKDQITGLVSLLFGAVIGFGAVRIADSAGKVELAVINASPAFTLPADGNLAIAEGNFSEQEWRERVESREIDGLLVISDSAESPWQATLTVRKEPTWLEELRPILQAERMSWQMKAANISPATLSEILTPVDIKIEAIVDQGISKADRLVAFSILGAMLITSWIGLAYMLTGITSEKQQRVTEQIVSAIRPQVWIDGKLIGITGAAIGSLGFLFATSFICLLAAWVMGWQVSLPDSLQKWELFPLLMLYYLGGVLFWNCFYAGVAAIIYDPNTSSRTSLLFLPILPMVAAALVVTQPDGAMMQTLAYLPGASSAAMPMRLVLGEVAVYEVCLSFIFMILGIAALRILAGRVFAAGIMLYGKEPTWLDIAKWTFKRNSDMAT